MRPLSDLLELCITATLAQGKITNDEAMALRGIRVEPLHGVGKDANAKKPPKK